MSRTGLFAGAAAALLLLGCHTTRPPAAARTSTPDTAAVEANSESPDSAGESYSARVLPIPELGYNAREGRTLYRHYCLNCHGDAGAGDGFNAYNLDPRPRALADSSFQAGRSDDDLVATITSGGPAAGLSTGMPPWGRTLNARQIRNIVEFLRSLRGSASR